MAPEKPVIDPSRLFRIVTEGLELLWGKAGRFLPGQKAVSEPAPDGQGDPTRSVTEQLESLRRDFEQAVVRLGVIGESGSGKSSLINALVGREVAQVGALVETTQQAQEVPVEGLTLVDLPGCGTPTWPKDTYVQRLGLLNDYDGFILVTAHRLKECDALLFDELARKAKRPFFVVRSHFDLASAAHGETEAREVITRHIRKQLGAEPNLPVYMISSVGERHYDLEKLILDIRQSLPDWKQVRFTLAARAYGAETLARKREAAERVVGVYAGLAAANALNPIPGLGVSVDVGLLKALSRQVLSAYGLTQAQAEALQRQATVRAAVAQGVREVADRFAPYLAERFVLMALRRMGKEVFLRNASRWVPYVGTLVSAGLGYKLTYRFGEQLIEECEAAAKEIVAKLAEPVAASR
jgi:predicted GTPase